MKASPKVVIVTLLVAVFGFLTEASGPFGSFWAPASDMPMPVGARIPLFMLLGAARGACAWAGRVVPIVWLPRA